LPIAAVVAPSLQMFRVGLESFEELDLVKDVPACGRAVGLVGL